MIMQNILRAVLTTVIILFLPCYSAAQQLKCTISGHITDMQSVPVEYASVAVYDNAKPIAGTITDNNGKFLLKIPQSTNSYELAVEFIGYVKYSYNLTPDKSNIDIGTISLKEDTFSLEGVTVTYSIQEELIGRVQRTCVGKLWIQPFCCSQCRILIQ